MSKEKTYRVAWETYKNGSHVFHVRQMTGRNAKEVRKAFDAEYGYIKGKVPFPYHLSVRPWKDYNLELPDADQKVYVWTEQGCYYHAYYTNGKFYCNGFTMIPMSIITKWTARII